MKKILTFIPLGVGISAAILYIFSLLMYRLSGNTTNMLQVLSSVKIYLYISILGFVIYAILRVINYFRNKDKKEELKAYEPLEFDKKEEPLPVKESIVVPKISVKEETPTIEKTNVTYQNESKEEKNYSNKYCSYCGNLISKSNRYCNYCGKSQEFKSSINPVLRKLINVVEIIILLLIIYFLVNILFEYKEKTDPNFKSPFSVSMTK